MLSIFKLKIFNNYFFWKIYIKYKLARGAHKFKSDLDIELHFLLTFKFTGYSIDVGANKGIYSIVFEQISNQHKHIIVEPNVEYISSLEKMFPNSLILPIAVGNSCGVRDLIIPSIEGSPVATRASLQHNVERNMTSISRKSIYCSTIDTIGELLGVDSISVIKIDVEGFEISVLEGAANVLKYSKPLLLVEIEIRHCVDSIKNAISLLSQYSYSGFFIDPLSLSLQSISTFDGQRHQNLEYLYSRQLRHYINNFIFVHSTKSADLHQKFLSFKKDAI
jgi:FkbM family methyltransferase